MRAVIAFAVCFALVGCRQQSSATAPLKANGLNWATVKYDGHIWVWCAVAYGGAIAHHPDCPCRTAKTARAEIEQHGDDARWRIVEAE